jgi:hypothetical protein
MGTCSRLSPSHPVGRLKAAFFRALGYSPEKWRQLEIDVRTRHLSKDARIEERTPYGQEYSIRAPLLGPSGRSAEVVSAWFVRSDGEVPRFVTAYPEVGR